MQLFLKLEAYIFKWAFKTAIFNIILMNTAYVLDTRLFKVTYDFYYFQ
jgi:hypothetical protein